jgi:rare lipoprotein A
MTNMKTARKAARVMSFAAIAAALPATASADPDRSAPILYASAAAAGPIDLRPGVVAGSLAPVAVIPPAGGGLKAPPVARAEAPNASAPAPFAGPPYEVDGRWYVPMHEPDYDEVGVASWYGPNFHGELAASGEVYDQHALTAAHPTLPIPSLVRVTNLENGRSVVVKLNDRGPFVDDRIIDLSRRAAEELDIVRNGTAKVRVQYAGPVSSGAAEPVMASFQAPAGLETKRAQPVQPAPAAPSAAAGFFLQAGSFADLENAHALKARLESLGPVSITSAQVNGGEFYRVTLGPWRSRAEADAARGRLAAAGADSFVVEGGR